MSQFDILSVALAGISIVVAIAVHFIIKKAQTSQK